MDDEGRWYRALGPARRPTGHPDYSLIAPGLYVGEYPTPDDAAWLRELGVTTVINLQDELDLASKCLRWRDLENAYRNAGIASHHVPIADGDGDMLVARLTILIELLDAALDNAGCVYLHCNAGMNRAPTVAIAYLHVSRKLSLVNACLEVKNRRPCLPYMKVLERHFRRQ